MVSQDDSSPSPTSSILHQFMIPMSITNQNQFEIQHFDSYGTGLRGSSSSEFPQSLGVLPYIDLVHAPPMAEESEINHNQQAQRFSLSLRSGIPVSSVQYRQRSSNPTLIDQSNYLVSGEEASYGAETFAIAIGNSKYLKPAQSLLEELVNIGGKVIERSNEKYVRRLSPSSKRGSLGLSSELTNAELFNNGLSAEKHELHAKLAKLIALLEEVERRYEQYYHHMEEVVSSFEVTAGVGAGNSYTALALQAMSKHFCNLRDSITSQINITRKEFSQDMPKISSGLSQLSLFDRQHRVSLQQLGLIQTPRQQWRPIRGLPETSVAILRAWLFEHFLHPYPNDSEKLLLASQTCLTKNQVSNWFINARVRLWKPMIEEMYKEEFVDSPLDSNPLLASSSTTWEGFTDHAEE